MISGNKTNTINKMNLKINETNSLKYEKKTVHTKWAILGPTPGSKSSSSIELGMSPSYFVRQISAIFFKLPAFLI